MAEPLSLMSCLREIEDPRRRGFAHRHDLQEMLVIAICAVLSDVDSFEEMAFWAQRKAYWLRRFLRLRGGIPSHDTFNRVFRLIDPKAFEQAFRRWVAGLVPAVGDGTLAIDGKTVRGSAEATAAPIHLVSAFATRLGVVLGQEKVQAKRNELSAMAELLDALRIRGYLVTLDAQGCQKAVARQILEKRADYVLAVKSNQPTLLATLQERFGRQSRERLQAQGRSFEDLDTTHGRLVSRRFWVADNVGEVDVRDWPGCCTLGMVETLRCVGDKPAHIERRYYISSRALGAEALARAVRTHWHVENRLHWMLDVQFGDDAATVRKDYAADNLARLKRIVLNLLRVETATACLDKKISLNKKRKLAAWEDDFRMEMLGVRQIHQ